MSHRIHRLGVIAVLAITALGMPGLSSVASAQPQQPQPISTNVTISQVSTQGPGGTLDEFIELRNIGAVPFQIGGYSVWGCTAQNQLIQLATIQPGTVLEPTAQVGQFYLLANATGYTRATPPDQFYTADIQRLGGVMLVGPAGNRIDAVGFSRNLACTETAPARAQVGFADQANLRVELADTNINAIDFALVSPAFPRNTSTIGSLKH